MSVVEKTKDWLRIFRAQTAPAVLILVLTPYLVAGGKLFSWYALLLAVWSIFTHHISFGHNTVMDTIMGWDLKDKNKLHHPLIKKRIREKTALKVIGVGIFISFLIAIFLVYISSGNSFYAMSFFCLFLVGGMVYNNGISKVSVWDFIPISIGFTALSLYSYFLVATEFGEFIILIALYIFLTEWFEIGIEGEIKEIEIRDESNMLRILGTKCDGKTYSMGKSIIYPWLLKLAALGIVGYMLYKFTFNWLTLSLFIVGGALALFFCYELTKKRQWDRKKSLRDMALEEVISIFLLPIILLPIIGSLEVFIIIVISIIYFVGMNAFIWNTRLAPKV